MALGKDLSGSVKKSTHYIILWSTPLPRAGQIPQLWENPEPLKPGEIYELNMVSYSSSNLFKAGHRIRVNISSSNYPHFDVNPNSVEPLELGRIFVVAYQKIYHACAII